MTAHPIDTEALQDRMRRAVATAEEDGCGAYIDPRDLSTLLDALKASEAEARRLSVKCGILKANHADDMEALRRESDEDTALALNRAVRAESQVEAIRDLHESDEHGAGCGERDCYPSCLECDEDYPCTTILALDSKLEEQ